MSRRPIPMFAATTAALGAAVLALAGCGGRRLTDRCASTAAANPTSSTAAPSPMPV